MPTHWMREREDGLGVEGITTSVRPDGDGWIEVPDTHPLRDVDGVELRLADDGQGGKTLTHDPERKRVILHLRSARDKVEADKAAAAEATALEAAIALEADPDVKAELEARRVK